MAYSGLSNVPLGLPFSCYNFLMNSYKYGLTLGAILSTLIVLSNVVFPSNDPDSSPMMLLSMIVIGAFIVGSSYHSAIQSKNKMVALKSGIIISVLGYSISMLTFLVIDNLFLDIVSKQADKILGFAKSNASSMQAFINFGLLRGLLIGLPASAVFGAVCGFIGLKLSQRISRH